MADISDHTDSGTGESPISRYDHFIHSAVFQAKTKSFKVDEYVPVRFSAVLTAKSVSLSDNFLIVEISAKYTFGGNVQGKATITVAKQWWSSNPVTVTKTIDVNGNGVAKFDLRNELQVSFQSYESQISLTVNAVMVEGSTRKSLERSA